MNTSQPGSRARCALTDRAANTSAVGSEFKLFARSIAEAIIFVGRKPRSRRAQRKAGQYEARD
jgi:hypothetical protein